jgi:hypothetical protein
VEGYGIEFLMRFFFIRDRFFKAFGFVWNKFFNGIDGAALACLAESTVY